MRRLAVPAAALTAVAVVAGPAAAQPLPNGTFVKGPAGTRLLRPPAMLPCAGHRLDVAVRVPRSSIPRGSYLSVNVYLRSSTSPSISRSLQKRTFFFRRAGSGADDLPAARCGRAYIVSYDVKVHGHRRGTRDFRVTVAPRT
jgi:hypothetical protein